MTEPNEPDKKNDETETTNDEAIIELEEVVAEEPQGDEEIIDLLEPAEEQEPVQDEKTTDSNITISENHKEIEDIGEPIEEFDDIDEFDNDLIKETGDFSDQLDTGAQLDEALDDDFADSLGIELDSKEDISKDPFAAETITDEKIEAALERVIKKVFYEKIDGLLAEAIEKTVTKEIERLKKVLLEDSPDADK